MSKSLFLHYFFILSLLSSIFLPSINIGGINLYGTTIASFFLIPFLFIGKITVNKYFFIILAMAFCVIISSLYSVVIGFSSETYRNYLEAIKYAQFLPYLIFAKFLNPFIYEKVFHKAIFFIVIFYIFIFFIQKFNFLGLSEFLINIYLGSESSHLTSLIDGFRLTLTGTDPNQGAAIGVFLFLYCLTHGLYLKKKKYLALAIILLLVILSTQSRTALSGMIFIVALVFIFNKRWSLMQKISALLLVFLFFAYLYAILDLEYVKVGIQTVGENQNHSVNQRLDNSKLAIRLFEYSPVFGVGPAKNELSTIIDSEYLLIIQRYGLMGIFFFSFFILNMIWDGFKKRHSIFGLILLFYTLFTLFVMLTNNAYSGYQLMSISVFLIISINKLNYQNLIKEGVTS